MTRFVVLTISLTQNGTRQARSLQQRRCQLELDRRGSFCLGYFKLEAATMMQPQFKAQLRRRGSCTQRQGRRGPA